MPHTSPIQPIFAPDAIEAASLAIIDSEVPEPRPYDGPRWDVVRRLIHTTADFELLDLVRFSDGAVRAGIRAIEAGATIVTDTEMARCAIPLRRLAPFGCAVRCFMNDPEVAAAAKAAGSTRAALAVDFALDLPGPLIFAIGNAPTALLRLLSRLETQLVPSRATECFAEFGDAREGDHELVGEVAPHVLPADRAPEQPVLLAGEVEADHPRPARLYRHQRHGLLLEDALRVQHRT